MWLGHYPESHWWMNYGQQLGCGLDGRQALVRILYPAHVLQGSHRLNHTKNTDQAYENAIRLCHATQDGR